MENMRKAKCLNSLKNGLGGMSAFSTYLLRERAYKQYTTSGLLVYGNSDGNLIIKYNFCFVNKNDNY